MNRRLLFYFFPVLLLIESGFAQPGISISPSSFNETINSCDDSVTKTLTITNTGSSDLNFIIRQRPVGPVHFSDGFESGNINSWLNTGGAYTRSVVTTNPATGTYCYEQIGGNGVYYDGIRFDLNDIRPTYISFKVKSPTGAGTWNCSAGFGDDNISAGMGLADFWVENTAMQIQIWGWSAFATHNIQNDVWYKIEYRNIDYGTKRMDVYVNDTLIFANFDFIDQNLDYINQVHLFGWTGGATSYYDDIIIGEDPMVWKFLSETIDTLSASGSVNIDVKFKSTDLLSGTYISKLEISSNDPSNPIVEVPCTLTVDGIPIFSYISDSCLDYGSRMIGGSYKDTVLIANSGCDTLFVDSLVNTLTSIYIIDTLAGDIAPGDTGGFILSFNPATTTTYEDTLYIYTNDLDTAICLTGTGIPAPDIDVSPTSFNVTLNDCDDSTTRTLTISNLGGVDLEMPEILAGYSYDSGLSYVFVTNSDANSVSVVDVTTNSIIGSPITVGTYPWRAAIRPDGKYVWISNRDDNTISVIRVSDLQVVATFASGANQPSGTAFSLDSRYAFVPCRTGDQVRVFDANTYSLVTTITTNINDPQEIAVTPNGRFAYVANQQSGITVFRTSDFVVIANISNTGSGAHSLAITPDGQYVLVSETWDNEVIVISTATNTIVQTLSGFSEPHGIDISPDGSMAYVLDKWNQSLKYIDLSSFTISYTINDSRFYNGWDLVLSPNGQYAYVSNPYEPSSLVITDVTSNTIVSDFTTGSGSRGMASLKQRIYSWLNVDVTSDTLAPSGSVNVTVEFNGLGLNSGTYISSIDITSNDPDENPLSVPCTLTIIGAPVMVINDTCIAFDTTVVGDTVSYDLAISNTGCDTLFVTNITFSSTEFFVDSTSGYLLPDEDGSVAVYMSPSALGDRTGTMIIYSDAGNDTLCLEGYALPPPDIVVTPTSFDVTVACGDSASQVLTFDNIGSGDLTYVLHDTMQFDSTIAITYTVGGALTNHVFPNLWSTDSLFLTITLNGDYDSPTSEYAELYIDGTYIGIVDDGNPPNGTNAVINYTFGGSQVLTWLSDGSITVTLDNTAGVGLSGTNLHQVDLTILGSRRLTPSFSQDTIAPSGTTSINMKFYSTGLPVGTYITSYRVLTNDPDESIIFIPCTLNVTGAPVIELSDTCLDLDSIMEFTSSTDTLYFYNTGCDTLRITNITSSNGEFTASPTVINIPEYDTSFTIITFLPTSPGVKTGTLTIFNNDVDTSICLTGEAFAKPDITTDPDSFDVTLGCSDTTVLPLKIYNILGGSDLTFNITMDSLYGNLPSPDAPLCAPTGTSTCCDMGIFNLQFGSINKSSNNSTEGYYMNFDSVVTVVNPGQTYTLSINTGTSYNHNVQAWIDYNDNGTFEAGELIITSQNALPAQTHTANVLIPATAVKSKILRMRVGADYYGQPYPQPCTNVYYGQFEDYGIVVNGAVSVSPASDTAAAGDSSTINVTFISTGLNIGSYGGNLLINSNDPLKPQVTIPFTLNVVGAAYIALSDTCLDLDSIMEYTSSTDTLYIYNTGCDTLTVTSITSSSPNFVPSVSSMSIELGDTGMVIITFTPDSVGNFSGTLSILNNDVDTSICLTGKGFARPILDTDPDSFNVTLACVDSVTYQLKVYNTGGNDLIFNTSGLGADPPLCTPANTSTCCNIGPYNVTFNTINKTTTNSSEGAYMDFTGSDVTTVFPGQTYVLTVESGPSNNERVKGWIDYNDNGVFEASEVVINTQNVLPNRIHTANVTIPLSAGSYKTLRMRIGSDYVGQPDLQPCVNTYYGQFEDYGIVVSGGVTWDVVADTVPAGDSTTINVTFNSSGLNAGTYPGQIIITSNDPLNPSDSIPVTLTVVGAPIIEFSDSCLDMDSIMEFTASTDTLWIYNTGCDTLKITNTTSSSTNFSLTPASQNILLGDTGIVIITFTPDSVGDFSGTLTFFNNDVDTTVCLTGKGYPRPVISTDPDTFDVTLGCTDSVVQTLKIYNTGGSDLNFCITMDSLYGSLPAPDPPLCTPSGTNGTCCNMGVFNVTFGSINKSTGNSSEGFFMSHADSVITVVNPGQTYVLSVQTGNSYDERVQAWIDYDDDGTFEAGELIITSQNVLPNRIHTANVAIPASAVKSKILRMRVGADYYGQPYPQPCTNVYYGQFEDYGIVVNGAVTVSPSCDTAVAGDSSLISVTFNSSGLNVGSYGGYIVINNNDPLDSLKYVPFTLNVVGAAYIALSDTCLDLDSIMEFSTNTDTLWIYNTGCDTLFATSITSSDPVFTVIPSSGYLLPGDSGEVVVTFSPDSSGTYSGVLTILNNDVDTTVCLSGKAFDRPVISFAPDTINVNLTGCCDSATVPVTIYNTGGSDLTFTIDKRYPKVLLLHSSGSPATVETELINTGLFRASDIDELSNPATLTTADLSPYDVVLVWTNAAFTNSDQKGDTLKKYVDNGGKVVLAMYSFNGGVPLAGDIMTANYSPFNAASNQCVGGQINYSSLSNPAHALFQGITSDITYWTNCSYSNPTLNVGGTLLANDNAGNRVVAENPGKNVLGIAIYPTNLGSGNAAARRLFANALYYVCGLSSADVTTTPTGDTVAVGDSSIVSIVIDGCDITPGNYNAQVIITSNDPLNSPDTIVINITKDSIPVAPSAADTAICFGSPTPDLIATGDSVKWYDDPALTNLFYTGDTFATGETAVGVYTYYITQTIDGCEGDSSSVILTINAPPSEPTANDSGACFGQSIPSLVSTGTIIQWYKDSTLDTLLYTGSPFPTGETAVGTYTYYVTDSVTGCSASPADTAILSISPTPAEPVANDTTICFGDPTPDLIAVGTGIQWYSDPGLTTLVFTGDTFPTGQTSAAVYTYYATQTTGGCEGPADTVVLTINSLPSAPTATSQTACEGGTIPDLTAVGTIVRWYDDAGLTNLVSTSNSFATGQTAAGVYTYYVTKVNPAGCEGPSTTVTLTIYAIPAEPTALDTTICFGQSTPNLTSTGTNVTWYSDGALTTLVYSGSSYATGLTAPGTYTYYVTQTVNGCASPADTSVLVINTIPSKPTASDTTICFGSPTPDLIAATDSIRWYDDGALTNLVFNGDTFVTGETAVGIYTYYVTQTDLVNGCQGPSDTVVLTINNVPAAPAASDTSSCFGDPTPDLTASGTNLKWFSDPALTTLVFTGDTFPTGETAVGVYTYYVTDSVSQCPSGSATTVTLTIYVIPSAPVAGDTAICIGDPTPDLIATPDNNVSWYSNPTLTTLVFSGDTFATGVTAAGTYTYYVTQTVNGCEGPADTVVLVINQTARPTAADKSSCFGFSVPDLTAAGTDIKWYDDGALTNLVSSNDTFATGETAVGVYTYYVTQTDTVTGCTSQSDTVTLTIYAIPAEPTSTDTAICFGQSTPNLTSTGSNVRWYSDGALTTLVYSGSSYATGQTAVGSYTYYATQTVNGCESPADTSVLTINAIPAAPAANDTSICFSNPTPDLIASPDNNVRWYSDGALTTLLFSGDTLVTGETAVGTYTYYVTQTVSNCQSPSDTVTLAINAIPSAPTANDTAICFGQTTPDLTATGTYVRWYSDAALTNLVYTGSPFPTGETAVGVYKYYVNDSTASCVTGPADSATLTINAIPSAPLAGDTAICIGDPTPDLIAAPDSNVRWYSNSTLTTLVFSGDTFATGITAVGTYTYYVTQTTNNCQGPADTVVLVINQTSPPSASDTAICFGSTTPDLIATGTNIQWYDDGALTNLVSSNDTFATGQTAVGVYTYYVTQTNSSTGCESAADTVTLTINAIPAAPSASSDTAICFGQTTPALSAAGSNVKWYDDAVLTNLVYSGTPFATGQTAVGVYKYYVTQTVSNCESPADSVTLTINAIPAEPTALDTTVCISGTIPDLTSSGAGARWYSDGALTALVYIGNPFNTGNTAAGTYTYYVTSTVNNCQSPADTSVLIISPAPVTPVVNDTAICFGSPIPDLVASGTIVRWFSDPALTTLVFTGNTFVTGQTAAGTYTYYVNDSTSACSSSPSDTVTLTINSIPAEPTALDTTVCITASIPDLTSSGAGAKWYSDGALTTLVYTGNPFNTGNTAAGTYTYYVTSTVNNCTGPADTSVLIISPAPVKPTVNDTAICFGSPTPDLIASGTILKWFSDPALTTLVFTGDTFVTGQTAAAVYTYYVNDSTAACSSSPSDTVTLTINAIPSSPVAADTAICFGSPTPDLIATGTNIQWYDDGALTNLVSSNDTFATGETAVGVYTYYVTQTVNNCTSPSDTVTLAINSPPSMPAGTDTASCFGSPVPPLISTGTIVKWYSDMGLTNLVYTGSPFNTGNTAVGTYTYYVADSVGGCAKSGADTVTLSIKALPAKPTATDTTICFGNPIPDLIASDVTARWYSDPALTTLVATNDTFATGQTAVGTYTYYVAGTLNGCQGPADTSVLVISPTPVVPNAKDTAICFGSATPDLIAAGTTVKWYSDPLLTTLVFTGDTFATGQTVANVYTYYLTDSTAACGASAADTVTLTINAIPSAPVSSDTTVCFGDPVPDLIANGTNVKWYSDSALTTLVISNDTFATGNSAPGAYIYYATQTISNCQSPSVKVTLNITPLPLAPVASDTFACEGSPIPDLIAAGTNIRWYSDSALTTLVSANDTFATGQTTANSYVYFATQTVNNCEGPAVKVTLTINAIPGAPAAADTAACFGDSIPSLIASGTNIQWYSDSLLTVLVSNNDTFATGQTAVAVYIYYVKDSLPGCAGPSRKVTLTINALPAAPVSSDTAVCFADSIPALIAAGTNIRWYSDSSLTTLVSANDTFATGQTGVGSYVYYATQSAGSCEGPAVKVTLTIKALPAAPSATDTAICFGSPTPDLITTGTNVSWYSDSLLTTLVSNNDTFVTGQTAANVYNYYVAQTVNGCEGPADTSTLTIYAIPSAPSALNQRSCQGSPTPDLVAAGSNIRWYSDSLLTTLVSNNDTFATGQTAVAVYTYYVTQTINGCESPAATVTLSIFLTPPAPTASDKAACFGGTIPDLTSTGSNIKWYSDSALTGLVFTGSPFATGNTAPGTYIYFVTDSLPGCVSTQVKVTLTINSPPATPVASDVTVCYGTSVPALTATGTTPQWYSDPQLIVLLGTGSSYNTGETAVGTYYYYVTDKVPGCAESGSDTVMLTINPRPLVTLNTYAVTITQGNSVTLTAYNGSSYTWAPPSGLNTTTGSTVIATPSVTTTYTVTASNSYGCTKDTSVTITVIPVTVSEIGVAEGIKVYPNPSRGQFTLDFLCKQNEAVVVNIYNTLGQNLYSEELRSPSGRFTHDFNLVDYREGVYFLQLVAEKGSKVYKLVIEY